MFLCLSVFIFLCLSVCLFVWSSDKVLENYLLLLSFALLAREAIFNSLDSFFDKINLECGGELEGDLDLMVVGESVPGLGRFFVIRIIFFTRRSGILIVGKIG